jgi:hypothetical protein
MSANRYLLPFLSLLVVTAASLQSTKVFAWGDLGHEVVCEIAFQELTPSARAAVVELMALDSEFRIFAKACSWPDHPRIRASEHFVNLPRDSLAFGDAPCPTADKCVVTATVNDMRDLGLFEDPEERLRLLKSLGHWVGDLHQPMHVSFEDDRGGNRVDVDSPCDNNLHAVWDTCIITETMGDDARTVAQMLRAEITQEERQTWFDGNFDLATSIAWADESLTISLNPATQYCVMDGSTCKYDETRVSFDGGEEKFVDANADYLQENSAVARQRLKMAGVRLAGLLNALLGEAPEDQAVARAPMSLDEVVAAARDVQGGEVTQEEADAAAQRNLLAQIAELERARDSLTLAIDKLKSELH